MLLYNEVNLNNSKTTVSSDSDDKGLSSVRVLLEQSEKGSLPSNGKCVINICTNKINSDRRERIKVHLTPCTLNGH